MESIDTVWQRILSSIPASRQELCTYNVRWVMRNIRGLTPEDMLVLTRYILQEEKNGRKRDN